MPGNVDCCSCKHRRFISDPTSYTGNGVYFCFWGKPWYGHDFWMNKFGYCTHWEPNWWTRLKRWWRGDKVVK